MAELIDYGNRLYFATHKKKGTRMPKPVRIRRPWDKEHPDGKRKPASSAEVHAFFSRRR